MFRMSTFENLVEKATSNMLLEPDWDAILQICDMIRQKDVSSKAAIQTIKKRLSSCNPNVVLESVVKNCGISVHKEVATKDFMLDLKDILKECNNEPIKHKILELIQIWSYVFRNEPNYHIVKDTYVLLKMEGYTFPMLKESDAMFMTENPPDWIDGENCHNCNTTFTLVQRKHHCRCCGQVFCQKCSSKVSIIPKYGIERVVRVCDECYDLNNNLTSTTGESSGGAKALKSSTPKMYENFYDSSSTTGNDSEAYESFKTWTEGKKGLPSEYVNSPLSRQPQEPQLKTEEEEREEIELALALSASEAEANLAKAAKASKYSYMGTRSEGNSNKLEQNLHPAALGINSSVEADMENELARYLDRSFWENRKKQLTFDSPKNVTLPSAPEPGLLPSKPSQNPQGFINVRSQSKQPGPDLNTTILHENLVQNEQGESIGDLEEFVTALRNGINIFVKRMQSNASRGRLILNDTSVQTLFTTLSHLQPKLLEQIKIQEDKRNHLENLQDKVSQIKESRAALIALRDEFDQKEKREAEQMRLQRELQLSQKLEYMRQKKRELMDYQRQVTLQRLAHEQFGDMGNTMPYQYNRTAEYPQPNPPLSMPPGVNQQPFMGSYTGMQGYDSNITFQPTMPAITNENQMSKSYHPAASHPEQQHVNYNYFPPNQSGIPQNFQHQPTYSENTFNLQGLNQAIDGNPNQATIPGNVQTTQSNFKILAQMNSNESHEDEKQNEAPKDLPSPALITFD